MSYRKLGWFLCKRTVQALCTIWVVLTGAFATILYATDPTEVGVRQDAAQRGEDPAAAAQAYRESMGTAGSPHELYVEWLLNYARLDWGWSPLLEAPVWDVVSDAVVVSAAWVLPGLAAAAVASSLLGIATTVEFDGRAEAVAVVVGYAFAAVPAFLLASVALQHMQFDLGWTDPFFDDGEGALSVTNLRSYAVPSAVLAVTVFGTQARYVRAQADRYVTAEFVTVALSKGLGRLGVARHVLRNAVGPILTVSLAELLAVFTLNIYVLESIFKIHGLGHLGLLAIESQDVGLFLGTVLVPVVLGLAGNLLVDVLRAALEPHAQLA